MFNESFLKYFRKSGNILKNKFHEILESEIVEIDEDAQNMNTSYSEWKYDDKLEAA